MFKIKKYKNWKISLDIPNILKRNIFTMSDTYDNDNNSGDEGSVTFSDISDDKSESFDRDSDDDSGSDNSASENGDFVTLAENPIPTIEDSSFLNLKKATLEKPIFIMGKERQTIPTMSRFEYARLIGERATLLEKDKGACLSRSVYNRAVSRGIDQKFLDIGQQMGVDPLVIKKAHSENRTASLDLAEMELESYESDFPLNVLRTIAPNVYEVWRARELETPAQVACRGHNIDSSAVLHGVDSKEICPKNEDSEEYPYWRRIINNTQMFQNSL